MTAAAPNRRAMLAKVHLAKKQLALADESYRDVIERVAGKRSAGDCSEAQLHKVLAEFERLGFAPKRAKAGRRGPGRGDVSAAMRPLVGKIRALNRALWNLGGLDDVSESALAAFVKRQAKVDDLRFLTPPGANLVIEALKARCARVGFEAPKGGMDAKRELLRAQWRALAARGAVQITSLHALDSWLTWKVSPHATCVDQLDAGQLDKAADLLGAWIRKDMARPENEG